MTGLGRRGIVYVFGLLCFSLQLFPTLLYLALDCHWFWLGLLQTFDYSDFSVSSTLALFILPI